MDIPFYIVHYSKNTDRRKRLEKEFKKYDINNVRWITEYDNDTLKDKEKMYVFNSIFERKKLTKSLISVTVKHWFSLENIIEKKQEVAVIMEDNVTFKADIKKIVNEYLKEAPNDWNVIYEGDVHYARYKEGKIYPEKKLYKKSNKKTPYLGGSSRCSNFYIINLESAKRMVKELETFSNVHDHWCNYIYRKLDFNIYWVEPPIVHRITSHKRLATLLL